MQNENVKSKWILRGLSWGVFMFLVMAIAMPYAEGVQLNDGKLLVKLVFWLVAGLAYGFTVHLIDRKKG